MQTKIELTQFRERLYRSLPGRGDAIMDLLDALSSNQYARSVVELSLSPAFRRGHSSFHRAIDRFFSGPGGLREWAERCALEQQLRRATQSVLDRPKHREHWLFAVDGTPYSRPHARTLEDRTWVHQSKSTSGRMPVIIGHQYSFVVGLPERTRPGDPAWVVPLSSRRVPSNKTPNQVGQEQIRAILDDPQLPCYEQCVVMLGDSAYSSLPFLGPMENFENLVLLTRIRGNRVFHRPVFT